MIAFKNMKKMFFGNDIKHVKAQTVISNTIDHHHRSRKMLDFDFYICERVAI